LPHSFTNSNPYSSQHSICPSNTMLFTLNRAQDCPLKRSFEKMMLKYNLSDQAKRLSGEDDFSFATDDTSSTGEFSSGRSSKLLNFCEEECMADLRQFCTKEGIGMSEQRLFRFACYHRFDLEKTKEAVFESKDNAFLDLEMRSSLRSQFVTKMLFPLTGLRTKKHNSQVIYSRPSRSDVDEDNMTKVL